MCHRSKNKKNGGSRRDFLEKAAQIEGIYVPAFYDVEYNEDGTLNFNPNSLTVLKDCVLEPSLKDAKAYDSFQFVRNGFFCVDCKDSEEGKPVFNRIVSLKSSFKLPK